MNDMRLNIRQMSDQTGISAHALRYYEKIGLLRDVPRSTSGYREYTEQHLQWITFVKHLRATGMPIREIQKYFDLMQKGDETLLERFHLLENHERVICDQLSELEANLERIRYKICMYKELISENSLQKGDS